MHEENIGLMVEETKRLLSFQIDLLEDMGKDPQVVTGRQSQLEQTFTREDMPKDLEVLRGELSKVGNLELVLAVVGTMKAGKSTTINAIVGTEVLPSRNVPMTTLPTLIRHTPGKAQPVLVLDNIEPLRKLAARLRGNPGFRDLGEKRHFRDVIAELSSGTAIQRRYQGASNIYKCLKMVNDLVRICAELGEEFPFGDYDEVHELPVIEVEFFHLKGSDGSSGRLVLLDTPGPNESKQPHLKKMMKDQLRKASAVIAVLDYTQLKSQADAEVRDELKALASMMARRLYAMVNKFDARDRNSYDAEEVKVLVASDLFQDRDQGSVMPADMIFPVSAQQAFLANRALRELDLNGGLPDPDDAPWVEDFGEEAFGRRWESKVQDAREVEDSARELWNVSFFGAPLDQVIKAAHSQAAILALDSAASKLVDYANKVRNFTTMRIGGLDKDIKVVEQQIRDLKGDIDELAVAESDADSNLEAMLETTKKTLSERAKKVRGEARKALNRYFDEGRTLERQAKAKDEAEKEAKRRQRSGLFGEISRLFGVWEPHGSAQHFDPDEDRITFSDRKEAKNLMNKMDREVRKVMEGAEDFIQKSIEDELKEFNDRMGETKDSLQERLNKIASRAKDAGFKIRLRAPSGGSLRVDLRSRDILDELVDEKEHMVGVKRYQENLWGWFCELFDTEEWGTEVIYETRVKYEISIKKARAQVTRSVADAFKGLAEAVEKHARGPLKDSTSHLFAEVRKNVERIRGDLIRGQMDRKLEGEKKTELISLLTEFQKRNDDLEADHRGLLSDVKVARQ